MSHKNFGVIFVGLFTIFSATLFSAKADATGITATVKLGLCGDSIIGTGEQCDGSALGGASCTNRGFPSGTLTCDASCNFNTSACVATTGGNNNNGGGGGGGSAAIPTTASITVSFSGYAYPGARVTVLRDGALVTTVTTGSDAKFTASVSGLSAGTYTLGIYATDSAGLRSVVHTYTETLMPNVQAGISDIIIPPTIGIDKSEVKSGDRVTLSGHAFPTGDVNISVHSIHETLATTTADTKGAWRLPFDTSGLVNGSHSAAARVQYGDLLSAESAAVYFTVGDTNVLKPTIVIADTNGDVRVNLIVFSVLAYWFKRPLTQKAAPLVDLNHDGKVTLVDFSIMAYYWTG